jgi:hypothetical protein
MKYISSVIILFVFISCNETGKLGKDKPLFESSAIITKYKAVEDMNDSYFVIKENNFFEYYKQLFDTVKNTRYPGKYLKNGDTMILTFYNKKGSDILGNKALINQNKKEILFFDNYPGVKKKWIFN